jgi:choice-of-anchor B domain-containing protein
MLKTLRSLSWPLLALMVFSGSAPLLAHDPAPCVAGSADIFPCDGIDLAFHFELTELGGSASTEGSDIWGWTDAGSGREFALVALTDSTAFVEITDSSAPVFLGNLPTHSVDVNVWRDVKTYDDHAFIVADFVTTHGMQIFDLSQLLTVVSPPVTFTETAHYPGFNRAHNIVINVASATAFGVGTDMCSGGLHMVDISTPTSPTFLGCFSGDGYTHDAQCVNYGGPDADYQGHEICVNSNTDTVTVVDVTDKANPVQISRTGYAGNGYTHQGWLTEDHAWFLLGDETDEQSFGHNTKTYIWDMSDLDAPSILDTYVASTAASDHNIYVQGDYAFASNYRSGLRILDITDVANGNLSEAAFFDTFPSSDAVGFAGAWSSYPYFESGTVIVSDIQLGLFVLTPTNLCVDFAGASSLSASPGGDHQIDLTWTDDALPGESYSIYRTFGACPGVDFELVAQGVIGGTYADTTVSGSVEYAYDVRKFDGGSCESLPSSCVSATTTGSCNAPAIFAGLESVEDPGEALCRLDLLWPAAQPNCGAEATYSVYRSETPGFVPDVSNRVAAGLAGTTWSDVSTVFGTTHHYVVRSTDTGNSVEDGNLIERSGTPTGVAADATWTTGAEVGDPGLGSDNGEGFGNLGLATKHAGWHLSEARAHTGNRSFFSQYSNNLCTGVKTPPLALTSGEASEVSFWTLYDIEDDTDGTAWDGGVVEISVEGSAWTRLDPLPGYPTTWRSSTDSCGYAEGTPAFSGVNLTWTRHSVDLSAWAGQMVEIRWQFSTDGGAIEEGWYVDDIEVTHVQLPGPCAAEVSLFSDGFESGDVSAWSASVP